MCYNKNAFPVAEEGVLVCLFCYTIQLPSSERRAGGNNCCNNGVVNFHVLIFRCIDGCKLKGKNRDLQIKF
jgi:hypothetical protein